MCNHYAGDQIQLTDAEAQKFYNYWTLQSGWRRKQDTWVCNKCNTEVSVWRMSAKFLRIDGVLNG
tara:strand:- start:19 stop:213 length:195 start_codon:yes stop_codon:yes gene_type:complete